MQIRPKFNSICQLVVILNFLMVINSNDGLDRNDDGKGDDETAGVILQSEKPDFSLQERLAILSKSYDPTT